MVCSPERKELVSKRGGDLGQGTRRKEGDGHWASFPPPKGNGLDLRPLLLVTILDSAIGAPRRHAQVHLHAHLSIPHPFQPLPEGLVPVCA